MPEGPEVHTTADGLAREITDAVLVNIRVVPGSLFDKKGSPGLEQFLELLPAKILSITAIGKKIIFQMDNDSFIISSMLMTGGWSIKPPKDYTKLWFELADGRKIYYHDKRGIGLFELLFSANELRERMADVGLDLLTDGVTLTEWMEVTRRKRLTKLKIQDFLMEQKYFSGIGNYLRAEILYRSRINPFRTLAQLSDVELEIIYQNTLETINESYSKCGYSISDYRDVNNDKGKFEVQIYRKSIDPLGNPVTTHEDRQKRTVHWVPNIQK